MWCNVHCSLSRVLRPLTRSLWQIPAEAIQHYVGWETVDMVLYYGRTVTTRYNKSSIQRALDFGSDAVMVGEGLAPGSPVARHLSHLVLPHLVSDTVTDADRAMPPVAAAAAALPQQLPAPAPHVVELLVAAPSPAHEARAAAASACHGDATAAVAVDHSRCPAAGCPSTFKGSDPRKARREHVVKFLSRNANAGRPHWLAHVALLTMDPAAVGLPVDEWRTSWGKALL